MSLHQLVLSLLNTENNNTLGDMAAKIALQNFDYHCATFLFLNSSLYIGVETFLLSYNYNVVISKGRLDSELTYNTRQYVVFNKDIGSLKLFLEVANKVDIKNTYKFIIVCQSHNSNDCAEQEATKLFWAHKIVNVVFIKFEAMGTQAFTYFPVSGGICDNVNPIKLNISSEEYLTKRVRLFAMKIYKLNFCPLIVTTFLQGSYMNIINGKPVGADGDLLRIIAQGLNTSLKIMTPHRGDGWGFRTKNGTWMGSLADLNADLANISMTSAALTLSRFSDYEISQSYYTVNVVWVTHPPALKNQALKLLRPFGYFTRIALLISYLLVLICAVAIKIDKYTSKFVCFRNVKDIKLKSVIFFSWMICMGQPINKLPKKSTLLQAIFLWIYYGFIIRTAYQVYLINSLKGKFYEDSLMTIEDAIAAKYLFGGGLALQDYYIGNPAIFNDWIQIEASETLSTTIKLSKGLKFVLAMSLDTAKAIMKTHKIKLHVLPQKVVSSPTVIFFKKYSIIAEAINLVLGRISAGGFPEKLHKDYNSDHYKRNIVNNALVLRIIHFTACYVILLIGWILSVTVFLLELYFGKNQITKNFSLRIC